MDDSQMDDLDSLAGSSSELQILPPPRHDELDRLLFHIPLETFGRRLQLAAEAVFPNNTESRYKNVHVLLICWEEGDPRLPVERELAELEDVFQDDYHFETETWRIPKKKGYDRALNRKITDFVELEDDSRDCLKIVYYGGHGFLSPSRQLMWSNLPSKEQPLYQSVKWHAIQATLEDAESDVLLLLDCCAAGTASTDNGRGVTELLGACAFNVTANGVGEFSFTTALSKELHAFSKIPSFTVGRLYNNLLRRIQMSLSYMTLQKAPIHVVLTQDEKLPRSIQLSPLPLPLEESESSLAVATIESEPKMLRGSPMSKASFDDSRPFSPESSRSSMTSLSLDGNKLYPRIALSVQLPGNIRADQLSEDLFRDWIRMIPVVAENVKVEAGWASFSTLLIVSVPMLIWKYIEEDPAVRMVGIIRSPNVMIPKANTEPKIVSSLVDKGTGLNRNFKGALTIVQRWFSDLGKRNQREVLFKLHDTRVARETFPQRFGNGTEEMSELDSDDWGSSLESYREEREPRRGGHGWRRARSRTRSSTGYSESVPDSEMAMVRFEDQNQPSPTKTSYSGRDSAYGSTTSGSRSRRIRRRRLRAFSSSSSSSSSSQPPITRDRDQLRDSFLGLSSRTEPLNVGDVGKKDLVSPPPLPSSLGGDEETPPILQPWPGEVPPPFRPARVMNIDNITTPTEHDMHAVSPESSPATYASPSPPGPDAEPSSYARDIPEIKTTIEELRSQGSTIPSAQDSADNEAARKENVSLDAYRTRIMLSSPMTLNTVPEGSKDRIESSLDSRRNIAPHHSSPELTKSESISLQEPAKSTHPDSIPYPPQQPRSRVVPLQEKAEDIAVKGILRQPREKFPEDPSPIREGVAPLKDARKDGVPPDARWTKISRKLVNPEALELGKERYEVRGDFVIVLRVLSKEEVQGYAVATQKIRAQREEAEEHETSDRRRNARRKRHELHKSKREDTLHHEYRRHGSNDDILTSDSVSEDFTENINQPGPENRSSHHDRRNHTTHQAKTPADQVVTPIREGGRTLSPDSTYSSLYQDSRASRS